MKPGKMMSSRGGWCDREVTKSPYDDNQNLNSSKPNSGGWLEEAPPGVVQEKPQDRLRPPKSGQRTSSSAYSSGSRQSSVVSIGECSLTQDLQDLEDVEDSVFDVDPEPHSQFQQSKPKGSHYHSPLNFTAEVESMDDIQGSDIEDIEDHDQNEQKEHNSAIHRNSCDETKQKSGGFNKKRDSGSAWGSAGRQPQEEPHPERTPPQCPASNDLCSPTSQQESSLKPSPRMAKWNISLSDQEEDDMKKENHSKKDDLNSGKTKTRSLWKKAANTMKAVAELQGNRKTKEKMAANAVMEIGPSRLNHAQSEEGEEHEETKKQEGECGAAEEENHPRPKSLWRKVKTSMKDMGTFKTHQHRGNSDSVYDMSPSADTPWATSNTAWAEDVITERPNNHPMKAYSVMDLTSGGSDMYHDSKTHRSSLGNASHSFGMARSMRNLSVPDGDPDKKHKHKTGNLWKKAIREIKKKHKDPDGVTEFHPDSLKQSTDDDDLDEGLGDTVRDKHGKRGSIWSKAVKHMHRKSSSKNKPSNEDEEPQKPEEDVDEDDEEEAAKKKRSKGSVRKIKKVLKNMRRGSKKNLLPVHAEHGESLSQNSCSSEDFPKSVESDSQSIHSVTSIDSSGKHNPTPIGMKDQDPCSLSPCAESKSSLDSVNSNNGRPERRRITRKSSERPSVSSTTAEDAVSRERSASGSWSSRRHTIGSSSASRRSSEIPSASSTTAEDAVSKEVSASGSWSSRRHTIGSSSASRKSSGSHSLAVPREDDSTEKLSRPSSCGSSRSHRGESDHASRSVSPVPKDQHPNDELPSSTRSGSFRSHTEESRGKRHGKGKSRDGNRLKVSGDELSDELFQRRLYGSSRSHTEDSDNKRKARRKSSDNQTLTVPEDDPDREMASSNGSAKTHAHKSDHRSKEKSLSSERHKLRVQPEDHVEEMLSGSTCSSSSRSHSDASEHRSMRMSASPDRSSLKVPEQEHKIDMISRSSSSVSSRSEADLSVAGRRQGWLAAEDDEEILSRPSSSGSSRSVSVEPEGLDDSMKSDADVQPSLVKKKKHLSPKARLKRAFSKERLFTKKKEKVHEEHQKPEQRDGNVSEDDKDSAESAGGMVKTVGVVVAAKKWKAVLNASGEAGGGEKRHSKRHLDRKKKILPILPDQTKLAYKLVPTPRNSGAPLSSPPASDGIAAGKGSGK